MTNDPQMMTFDELYAHQERITKMCLAQQIRLSQWRDNGILFDDQDDELLVGENSEVLKSLQRKKDQRKKEILALDQRIRLEKERDRRNKEMDSARKKKK
jgi:hypothetical protein